MSLFIIIISFVAGMILGVVLNSLPEFRFGEWFKIKYILKVKAGDIYATYNLDVVEDWIVDEYIAKYEVKSIGKRYIRLKLIDKNTKTTYSVSDNVDVDKYQFSRRYKKFKGMSKNRLFSDILK